jgi:hypothetical protein
LHHAFTVEDLNAVGRVADPPQAHAMIEPCSDTAQIRDYQPHKWPNELKPA